MEREATRDPSSPLHRSGGARRCSSSSPSAAPPALTLTPDAVRLAAQATFGPTVAVVQDIEQSGAAAWVDAQLQLPPSDLGTYPVIVREHRHVVCPTGSPPVCARDNFSPFLTQTAFFRNAIAGPDQLRQRVAFALSQIVVVSGAEVRPNYGIAEYQKLLLRDAFGTYRQVMRGRDAQPGHGALPEHGQQRQAEPCPGDRPQRELRPGGDAALLHRPGAAPSRRLGGRSMPSGVPVPTYDQDVVDGLAHGLHRLDLPAATRRHRS